MTQSTTSTLEPATLRDLRRSDFAYSLPMGVRWADVDQYGHVNNVAYYAYFDTAVNQYLMSQGALDPQHGAQIGLVVRTECDYFASIEFADVLEVAVAVLRVGTSSVQYQIAVFTQGREQPHAVGRFVHVYVDAQTRQPQPLNDALLTAVHALKR